MVGGVVVPEERVSSEICSIMGFAESFNSGTPPCRLGEWNGRAMTAVAMTAVVIEVRNVDAVSRLGGGGRGTF